MIRTYEDSFSNRRIYPGKGKIFVRGDSKFFRFQSGKTESLFLQRKNPRLIAWTILYRRKHKKGIKEETSKRRTRRTVKAQRAIVGASLDVIKERQTRRPEARAAARAQSVKEAKEAKAKQRLEKGKAAAGRGIKSTVVGKEQAKGFKGKVAPTSR